MWALLILYSTFSDRPSYGTMLVHQHMDGTSECYMITSAEETSSVTELRKAQI